MKEERKNELKNEIKFLEERLILAKSMQEKLDLKDRILHIKMELNETKLPTNSEIECVGCGS